MITNSTIIDWTRRSSHSSFSNRLWERIWKLSIRCLSQKKSITWELCVSRNSTINEIVERLSQILMKQIFVMLVDVFSSLKKIYWSKIILIVTNVRNRQFVININCNFYKKYTDVHLKFDYFRAFEQYGWANEYHSHIDWKKLQFRTLFCKLFDYENDIIFRMFHFNKIIFRIDKFKGVIRNNKRKVDSFFDVFFKKMKIDVVQKISIQINRISFFFAFTITRSRAFLQFLFRDSHIIEIDFDIEKFFNFLMIFVSSTRFALFFVLIKQNKILAKHFELQNRDFFFDFFDVVAFIVTILDKIETKKFEFIKKSCSTFITKWIDN